MSALNAPRAFISLLVISASLAGAVSAEAACAVQPATGASFGVGTTSFVVRDTSLQTSTSAAGLVCSGAVLSVLGTGDHVFATVTSLNGGLKGPTGDVVAYGIYGDGTVTYPIPTGVQFDYASGQLLNVLGLFGGPSRSLPMFFRTTPGSVIAAGTYTDTLSVSWNWDYCTGIGLFGICLGRDVGSGQSTFQLTLTVTNACEITSTPDVAFGQAPVPSAFGVVAQELGVLCTKGLLAYSVGIDRGQHYAGSTRRMASNGAHLDYDVFKAASPDVWGPEAGQRHSPQAPANGLTPQTFPYSVRIRLPQATPPVGIYQDVLIVDVTF